MVPRPEHIGRDGCSAGQPVDVVRAGLAETVLVPLANPRSFGPLAALAASLAAPDRGRVVVVVVLPRSASSVQHGAAVDGLAEAEAAARRRGVPFAGRLVRADDVVVAVREAAATSGATMALLGWKGRSNTDDVFGRILDGIVGRSAIPVVVVRAGEERARRTVLPVDASHLGPGGASGLGLAAAVATRIAAVQRERLVLLRTGSRGGQLPDAVSALGDRVHRDHRRLDRAVGAVATARDVVVAPVAPTVAGLRAASTHLLWAAPEASLAVAIDPGPTAEHQLAGAVVDAGRPRAADVEGTRPVRVRVTVRSDGGRGPTTAVVREHLAVSQGARDVMTWWRPDDPVAHVSATIEVEATTPSRAITAVMVLMHGVDELRGAEIEYEIEERADDAGRGPGRGPR